MVTKVTYVGEGFTRKPPKYERFIRPMALRFKKAHVTHPEVATPPLLASEDSSPLSSSLVEGHIPSPYHWSQEKSPVSNLYQSRGHHQGNHN